MAVHARTVRSVITGILKEDEHKKPLVNDRQRKLPMFNGLYALFNVIRQDLQPLLDTSSFAAQTIVYGLFIARYNQMDGDFDKFTAIGNLIKESDLLEKFFNHIATTKEIHPMLDTVIEKLCNLYKICDIYKLIDENKSGDTIVHFYLPAGRQVRIF